MGQMAFPWCTRDNFESAKERPKLRLGPLLGGSYAVKTLKFKVSVMNPNAMGVDRSMSHTPSYSHSVRVFSPGFQNFKVLTGYYPLRTSLIRYGDVEAHPPPNRNYRVSPTWWLVGLAWIPTAIVASGHPRLLWLKSSYETDYTLPDSGIQGMSRK